VTCDGKVVVYEGYPEGVFEHPQGSTCDEHPGALGVVDMVNHPPHYTSDPSGVECITITRHRNFNIGNAIKCLWRAGLKLEVGVPMSGVPDTLVRKVSIAKQVEDLKKAIFYINDEIGRLESENNKEQSA
jgi:hypothetical protein